MVKRFVVLILCLFICWQPAQAVELDSDENGAIDIVVGGTNATTAAGARTNLGLAIDVNVQAYDIDLTTYAGISPSANVQSLLAAADYAAMKTLLSLTVGTNIQAFDADLATLAAPTAWRLFYSNGSSAITELSFGAAGSILQSTSTTTAPTMTNNPKISAMGLVYGTSTFPTTVATIKYDSTNHKIYVGDGTNAVVHTTKTKLLYSLCIQNPTTSHTDIKQKMPTDCTITAIYGHCVGGTNIVGRLYEVDADADDADKAGVDDADWTITSAAQFSDTSLTNGTIDAGDWLQWDTASVSGSPTMCCIDAWGYER